MFAALPLKCGGRVNVCDKFPSTVNKVGAVHAAPAAFTRLLRHHRHLYDILSLLLCLAVVDVPSRGAVTFSFFPARFLWAYSIYIHFHLRVRLAHLRGRWFLLQIPSEIRQ